MNKRQFIKQCYEIIIHCTGNMFVTLRGHDEIPNDISIKNDIDILLCGRFGLDTLNQQLQGIGFQVYVDQHRYIYGAEPHIQFFHNKMDVKLDFVTGLYYRSVADKMVWATVNKEVFQSMIRNRVYDTNSLWRFRPAYEDELVHIICHCIFDKRKTSDKYVSRINELLSLVDKDKVKYLLSCVFYAASDKVFETMSLAPEKMYETYISFMEY